MIRSHRKGIKEILGRDSVHPFPARMAPGIALDVLESTKGSLRVLDPMMGSGTVIAVARSRGHRAVGIDIDPLAVLISKVWTTPIDRDYVEKRAAKALARARSYFDTPPSRGLSPKHADKDTRKFLSYWFDPYARRQLASLATSIREEGDVVTRNTLWCAFSRLIITKQAGATLAMDLSHSRPHRKFKRAPTKPFTHFEASVQRVVENCITKSTAGRGPVALAQAGDARDLPLGAESIDLVLTSPPYLNAIDYIRCSKFTLVWMGYTIPALRKLRGESVGSEVGLVDRDDEGAREILKGLRLRPAPSARWKSILLRYIDDIGSMMGEVERVLVPRGKAVFVVGESTLRGTYVQNSAILTAVAEASGLRLDSRRGRTLPANRRYLPPPSASRKPTGLDVRMRREVVLAFSKP